MSRASSSDDRARLVLLACLIGSTACLSAACDDKNSSDSQHPDSGKPFGARAMLEDLTNHVFVPNYEHFEDSAQQLLGQARGFCEQLSELDVPAVADAGAVAADAGLDAGSVPALPELPPKAQSSLEASLSKVRAAWRAARADWKTADAFAFGPYIDDPPRVGPAVDTWPVRPERVAALLGGDEELTQSLLSEQGGSSKGLPVIEYLLFEPADEAAALGAFWHSRLDNAGRRCDFLVASAEELSVQAKVMRLAWTAGERPYSDELTQAGQNSEAFDTLHAAVGEVLNRMVFAVENVRQMKLATPAALDSEDEPQLDLFESPFSDNGARDAMNTIIGVRNVYLGEYRDEDGLGIQDYVRARKPELDDEVLEAFERALKLMGTLDSFAEAAQSYPVELESLFEHLRVLQLVLGVDVAGVLGVTVTFNDTDGD